MSSETVADTAATSPATEDMELVSVNPEAEEEEERENGGKRDREEENGVVSKKQKLKEEEKSVEEVRMEKNMIENVGLVGLGPKSFGSSVEMFDYFYKFLHHWPVNVPVNKYEHLVLLDLITEGHSESAKKIGSGVNAFEIRYHPIFQSRCFFVVRGDNSEEDFSFRKCVDHILPLPENMKIKSDVNKVLGGKGSGKKGSGGGRGSSGGRGRGGRSNR